MMLNSLDKIRTMEINIQNMTEAMEPVNREDIILHLRKNTKLDEREILNVADECMEYATKNKVPITRADLMDMASQAPEVHDVRHVPWDYTEYYYYYKNK